MKDSLIKSAAWVLSSTMVLGTLSQGDDGSPYRDARQDAFAIAMTGPSSLSDSRVVQNTITGDLIAGTSGRNWMRAYAADPSPARSISLSSSSSTAK